MRHMRLTHPSLDFWIDVRLRKSEGRWLAVADLAGSPELGTGSTAADALRHALTPFPSHLRDELTASAVLQGPWK